MNSLNGESLVSTLSSIPMYYLSLFPLLGAMAWKRSYMFFCGSVWEMSKSSILWIGMGFVFLFPQRGLGVRKIFQSSTSWDMIVEIFGVKGLSLEEDS